MHSRGPMTTLVDPSPQTGLGRSRLTVSRNLIALAGGELLARVLAFGVSLYVAREVGAEGYGVIGFGLAVTLYFATVAEWGLDLVGARDIARRPRRVAALAGQVFSARLLLAVVLAGALAAGALLILPRTDGLILALFSGTVITTAASTRWIHLGLERSGLISITRTGTEIIKVAVVLRMVRGPEDLIWIPIAQVAGEALMAGILGLPLLRLGFRPRWPTRRIVVPVFRRGWPLMLTGLLGVLVFNSDLVYLRAFRGATEAGLYMAAFTLITYLGVLGTVARSSLVPTLTRLAEPERQRELHESFLVALLAFGLPLAAGGTLLAGDLIRVGFGSEYERAGPVLALLIWSVPLLLARSGLQALLVARGRQDRVLRMTAWTAGVAALGGLLLVPMFGMTGAATITLGGEMLRLLIAVVYVHDEGFGLLPLGRLALPATATLVMTAGLLLTRPPSLLLALPLGVLLYGLPYSFVMLRQRARAWARPRSADPE